MATMSTALLRRTARAAFWQNFEAYPDMMEGIIFRTDSDADQETYPWLAYAPGVQEMQGGRTKRTVPALDWTIKNKKWENTVALDYEIRRFNKINSVNAMVGNLGAKARAYPNELVATLMNTGDATACYDTQFFYDTDHSDPGADYTTSQSNDLTTSIVDKDAPTDLEFAAAVRAMIDAFYGFKDGDGDPVVPGNSPRFICTVPPGMRSVAMRVQLADSLTGPVANDLKGQFETRVNVWSDATDEFQLHLANGARKPFIYQVADDITIEDDAGGDSDFNTKEISFGSFGYYNLNYGDWRYSVLYVFTTT